MRCDTRSPCGQGDDVCDRIRSGTIAQTEHYDRVAGRLRLSLSTESVEYYVHDALHLVELSRVQGVGHLDMSVAFPLDRDEQSRGAKINQLEAVVADVTVVVCLDVASPAIRCLELSLNDEIGAVQPRRISGVIAGIFGLERKPDNNHPLRRRKRISRENA
jgi:hypothetical protein